VLAVPPHIGLNLLFLEPGRTGGMEIYARALVPELVKAWPQARFTAFVGRELALEWSAAPWHDGVAPVALPFSSATRVRRTAVEMVLLPAALRRAGVDLVHSLASVSPPVTLGTRSVVTIHDLIYKRFPETHRGLLARGMAALVPLAARRADRVVVDSEAAKAEIVEMLGVPAGKVDAVPLGPGLPARAPPTPEAELRTRLALGGGRFVLSVSAKRPHKNLRRLIEALADVPADATLVIPGYPTPFEKALLADARRLGVAKRVCFCGWVSDADLEGLYAAATCLAFPSLAEGFGLPVLEAMRRDLPVVCSAIPVLTEVAGDAAVTFDPLDPAAIAAAVARVLDDGPLRADLVGRGRTRAERFSWRATAEGTVAAYRRVLKR
jgi:glycosyltransferase involved in cell wall biosynthesis